MKTSRTVLNELKWRSDRDFSNVEVEYIHRGGPEDLATVSGADIISLEAWMMVIRKKEVPEQLPGRRPVTAVPGEAAIPYHRITRIIYDGRTVFDRRSGKDLIDAGGENSGADAPRAGEEEGIYPEPPGAECRRPNVVDAHDDDVAAADFRDMEEGADTKHSQKKAQPKKVHAKEKPRKSHPSKMVKRASGTKAKRK